MSASPEAELLGCSGVFAADASYGNFMPSGEPRLLSCGWRESLLPLWLLVLT